MRSAFCSITLALLFFWSSNGRAAEEAHIFYGDIVAVDPAAKTFEIKSSGTPLIFHYTEKTKLSSPSTYVRWEKLRPGDGARVQMHLGEGNIGIADEVEIDTFGSKSKFLSLLRARTAKGDIVSGFAVANYIASEPRSDVFSRALMAAQTNFQEGVFVLAINPDGSVGRVTAAKSLGDPELNERAAAWLRKWRFRAGTVKEVQLPIKYLRVR
ncbi:MAG: energy transducer TonB [Verrucomicrobiota bacterium]|nr:energy transducer TonB [Verrucomicrobiota bacterium]